MDEKTIQAFGPEAQSRFWRRVHRGADVECWAWTAGKKADGYGQFFNAGKNLRAHRISWALANGPIPTGYLVLHRCDNPSCVNPGHLFLGSDADNTRDKVAKARHARGARNGASKLTAQDVLMIRELCSSGEAHAVVARMFRVARTYVTEIVCRTTWKHI